ncbi:Pkinase-domain-containing protein [Ascobolus immersus RN42]|uniref:Pkinase-domain-containing protein n=1 Tax=Ascobolus immersus RN42 TaxID=1160509 RepID=A0A3N4I3D9_ASCIM|nr:Pkinase-domain-containing protein [Ascobolus immersus RN42]
MASNGSSRQLSNVQIQDPSDEEDSEMEVTERMNIRTRNKFVRGKKLGEGTYAIVYLGHDTSTTPPTPVAIKKIKLAPTSEGLSMDAIREVKYLRELHHPNIISLLSIYAHNSNLSLVLEFLPGGDLELLMKDQSLTYSTADIKSWMGMAIRGLAWCHRHFVLHRDIKPNNLLLAADGVLKLGDFGLARSFADPMRVMTNKVITLWYRPPELLYGARFYSGAVDVWSLGTVFAELILRTPLLPGQSDLGQLSLIAKALGAPSERNWPGVSALPDWVPPTEGGPEQGMDFFVGMFASVGVEGAELVRGMLRLDPKKRVTAEEALRHKWFQVEPRATHPSRLPRKEGGEEKVGRDLGRGWEEDERVRGVGRRLDFGGAL